MKYKSTRFPAMKSLLLIALPLLAVLNAFAQPAITLSNITGHTGQYELREEVTFQFTINNTTPAATGNDAAANDTENRNNTAAIQDISGKLIGRDIYGNDVVIKFDKTSFSPGGGNIAPASNIVINGQVTIPNDGTLHNIDPSAYQIKVDVELNSPLGPIALDTSSSSTIMINADRNLRLENITYAPGTYRAGDIIQLTAYIRNRQPTGVVNQSRPLLPIDENRVRMEFFLSEDPALERSEDFLLGWFQIAGSSISGLLSGSIPDGESTVRVVRVENTPPPLVPYDGVRAYTPQADDGVLDIDERIRVTMEVMIPNNITGSFFVAGKVDALESMDESSETDNIFVQTLTPQIQIDSSTATTTEPVSEVTDRDGNRLIQSDGVSDRPSVSEDGVWIAFESTATNLISGQNTNGRRHIFLRNRETREIELVSVSNSGEQGNRDSRNAAISANGRYIVYESLATNLVSGVQGAASQIYIYDRVLQRTDRVSINQNLLPANGSAFKPAISDDGSVISFHSIANNLDPEFQIQLSQLPPIEQVYVHNRNTNTTRLVSVGVDANNDPVPANERALDSAISLDGDVVAFVSRASNFGIDPKGHTQVWFSRISPDGDPGSVELASAIDGPVLQAGNNDSSEPAVNGGWYTPTYGLQIVFASKASDLVVGDTNQVSDIFVRDFSDQNNPKTVRLSVSNPRVSFGTISFVDSNATPRSSPNLPDNQPSVGDSVTLNDGNNTVIFTFGPGEVPIGANTAETRDNLVAAINAANNLNIVAYASSPPTSSFNTASLNGFFPALTLFNTEPGIDGNQPISVNGLTLSATGMAEGGTEAFDWVDAEVDNPFSIAQGSLQPSIDRSGRLVAFRSLGRNLDVIREGSRLKRRTADPDFVTPAVGELIRPLIRFSSNVYFRDRDVSGSGNLDDDFDSNTARASVNPFGYPTSALLGTPSSASSRMPAVSANGRFVAFASDAENTGGLRFGDTNTQPLDNNSNRDVFIFDRASIIPIEQAVENPPFVTMTSPITGTTVSASSPFFISASAIGFNPATQTFSSGAIRRVTFFVNGQEAATLTERPFTALITPRGEGPLRIFAIAEDTRGNTSRSTNVQITAEVIPFQTPQLVLTKPSGTGVTDIVRGESAEFEARVFNTANAADFLNNFTLDSAKFYVNGSEVFSTSDASQFISTQFVFENLGQQTITASVTYREILPPELIPNRRPTFVNVFSDQATVQVRELNPILRDRDFVVDINERLLGRSLTDRQLNDAASQLDGTFDSRVRYLTGLINSPAFESPEIAAMIYRTMLGIWPNTDALTSALQVLLGDNQTASETDALTSSLIPEYVRNFGALNTDIGFIRQVFRNKHKVVPNSLAETRLLNSLRGGPQLLENSGGRIIPGYSGNTVSFITQFALDNDKSGITGPGGLPLSALHLYPMPNDATKNARLAIMVAGLLEEEPTDAHLARFNGVTQEAAVRQILQQYLGQFLPAIFANATSLGNNWYHTTWLGSFAYESGRWVYSRNFGWLFVTDSAPSASGVWLYSQTLQTWLYGGPSLSHWFYSQSDAAWLWVPRRNNARTWFYSTGTGNWSSFLP